jgi:hypothetical protein
MGSMPIVVLTYFFCWLGWEATRRLLASLAIVADFCANEPDVVTLLANSRFAVDHVPVRAAALLALSITTEPWLPRFIRVLPLSLNRIVLTSLRPL